MSAAARALEPAPALTLVVVSWNSAELLPDSIQAFRASAEASGTPTEIVVVDNASTDGSAEAAREAGADTVVENPVNVGFVVAASQGISRARGPWVLLANPDLRVAAEFVGTVAEATAGAPDDVAALVPDVRFASNPRIVNSRGLAVDEVGVPAERQAGGDAAWPAGDGDVFGASSSASVLRVEALRRVGGLEPAYFAYLEDVDIAWRLRKAGYRAVLLGGAIAVHEGSASTGEGSWLKAFLVARNRRILFRLHGPYTSRARVFRAVTEVGHATVQALSGSRGASIRGRIAARQSHRYTRFARHANELRAVPGVVVPLAPRFRLLETLRRKQTATSLMHRDAGAVAAQAIRLPPTPVPSAGTRPVRVLVDAANLKPGQGGIRSYTMGLIAALAREPGLSLTVATSVPEVAELGDVEIRPLASYTRSALGRAAWRETHLASLARSTGADVVVSPVPELPYRRLSTPTVVVVHDLGPFVAPAFYTRNKRVRYTATLRQACSRATSVVCVSNTTLLALHAATGIDPARCLVIGEGPQLLDLPAEAAAARDGPYLLCVGALDPRKNVGTLVDAVLDADPPLPANLVIVGPTEGTQAAELAARAKRAPGRVEHRGFVSARELAELYSSCVAVVQPSLYEGFGLPVLEAFNAGAPVVASDIPTVREIAGDAALYVSRPLEPACWREALLQVCTNEALRDSLRTAGRTRAEVLTWADVARRFAEVIVACAAGGAEAAPTSRPRRRAGAAGSTGAPTRGS